MQLPNSQTTSVVEFNEGSSGTEGNKNIELPENETTTINLISQPVESTLTVIHPTTKHSNNQSNDSLELTTKSQNETSVQDKFESTQVSTTTQSTATYTESGTQHSHQQTSRTLVFAKSSPQIESSVTVMHVTTQTGVELTPESQSTSEPNKQTSENTTATPNVVTDSAGSGVEEVDEAWSSKATLNQLSTMEVITSQSDDSSSDSSTVTDMVEMIGKQGHINYLRQH